MRNKKIISFFISFLMFFSIVLNSVNRVKADTLAPTVIDYNDPTKALTKVQLIVSLLALMGLRANTPDYGAIEARAYDMVQNGKFVLEQAKDGTVKITNNLITDIKSLLDGLKANDSKIVPIVQTIGSVKYEKSDDMYDYYITPIFSCSNYSFNVSIPSFTKGDNLHWRRDFIGSGIEDFSKLGFGSGAYIAYNYETGDATYISGIIEKNRPRSIQYTKVQYRIIRPKLSMPLNNIGDIYNTRNQNTVLPSDVVKTVPSAIPMDFPVNGTITYNPNATIGQTLSTPKDIVSVKPVDSTKPIEPPVTNELPDSSRSLDFTPFEIVGKTFSSKFPFCIPFDIANSIKTLNVPPNAPKWILNFDSKYFVGGGSVTIDFSMFEKWAVVIRWGIMFLFTMFLMLITRKIMGAN